MTALPSPTSQGKAAILVVIGIFSEEQESRFNMFLEQIKDLIVAGETLDVEFKGEERHPLSDRELVEAVVCLANRPGTQSGWLLLGVEDDGRITGTRPRHESGATDPFRVQALIANRTRPALTTRVEEYVLEGKPILAIEVQSVRTPVGTAEGKYIRRAIGGDGKPACLPFHFHEMQSYQADRGSLDYSAFPVPDLKWDELDPLEFERFRRRIRENPGRGDESLLGLSDQELAKALGAVEANHQIRAIRILGLLLFGREKALRERLPTHEMAFQVFADLQVEVNDFFRWPLLRAIEEVEMRFRVRNREQELVLGMFRIGIPDYPERAFREAVANAMIHRDYSRLGAIHIQWHEDRIEIASPGGFPEGVHINNLLVTPPIPRNPLLADALKRAGVVERTARGIDLLFYEQLRNGRPAPSYERSTSTSVVLVFPGGSAHTEFVRLVVEESQRHRPLRLDDLILLQALWQERSLDSTRAALRIQKPEAEAHAVLQRLVEHGLAEARGERKGRSYHLSASTYRRLDQKEAYIRQKGFEPFQQEQMVLQYIDHHGRITRQETAALCQVASHQARDLLKKLVQHKLLEIQGKGRGTFYVRSAK